MQVGDKKQCNKCKKTKSITEFHKNKRTVDGLQRMCKDCTKQYYEENKERRNNQSKARYESHKEEMSEYYKEYKIKNAAHVAIKNKEYYDANKEKFAEYHVEYMKSENGVEAHRKANYKRKKWGIKPINNSFSGSEFHHLHVDFEGNMDREIGVYIPKELHRSVFHSYKTWQGMTEINKIALDWYHDTYNKEGTFRLEITVY